MPARVDEWDDYCYLLGFAGDLGEYGFAEDVALGFAELVGFVILVPARPYPAR